MDTKELEQLVARIELLEFMEARRLAREAGDVPKKERAYFNNLHNEVLDALNPLRGNMATNMLLQHATEQLMEAASDAWSKKFGR